MFFPGVLSALPFFKMQKGFDVLPMIVFGIIYLFIE